MRKFINVHCHLLNFEFVPDSFFKITRGVPEWILRHKLTSTVSNILTFLLPGPQGDKFHEVLNIMNMEINKVVEVLVDEMEEAGIVLATPLMMDLKSFSDKQSPGILYEDQIELISNIAAKYPWKIMPFIMFDPRRPGAFDITKNALKDKGFLGVKMYPSLGYHPNPCSGFNKKQMNKELKKIYKYCANKSIPITTHCSKGGAYRVKRLARRLSHPLNWIEVLEEHPDLCINFAHFGGPEGRKKKFLNTNDPGLWCNVIQKLMIMKGYKNVYADTSYHEGALKEDTAAAYYAALKKLISKDRIKNRIIFGTDWLMTRHTWPEKKYVGKFIKGLPAQELEQVAFDNPLRFLFPGGKVPQRIKDFYTSKDVTDSPPEWMKQNLTI
jgi:predicted TIM-barrel fold metal-dependent hydrolase